MRPVRCFAGQFFGGYPYKFGIRGAPVLERITMVITDTTDDTATELEVEDWDALNTSIDKPHRQYNPNHVDRTFRYKCDANDATLHFDLSNYRQMRGLKTKTQTNCRPIYWIR